MTSDKKPRAVPNSNPLGLSAREVEVMILAWLSLEDTPKIDKQRLAKLANFDIADSAIRQFNKTMAHMRKVTVESTTAPGTPGTPNNGKGADGAADSEPSSVAASDKKKNKKAAGGKVAGRKRTMKEADDGDSGDEGAAKKESEGGERPKKIPKHFKGKPIVTLKKLEAAEGSGDGSEAGEV